ncbi:uncharacterized protein LOC114310693 [Camellia sinensis]|uniref:uncharacterized protein LOC114310693 n=1 Tax=Camellia sinensis TaxID=4442 RepID=UPI0010355863|nr:uncharacterized protein LOC114310693 [Camellia sinensis]
MNNSYNLWPVILIPYNLPPWLVMKDPFSLMSLLIPGESQPGIDIDVYMRPLVDELNDLWTNGALTYDAYTNETFRMPATLLWTIHDWPAFVRRGTLTIDVPEDHPERRKSRAYNGKIKKQKRSLELPTEKTQDQLDNVTGIDGKNKDTYKARLDLEDMGIRKKQWLTQRPDGSYVKPRAIFSLTPAEREGFFEFLKTVKYPNGYAENISKSVNARNGRLTGLKSHDYHVLIQRIIPIGMRGYVDKEISTTLFELGNFFQDLCSRTLRRSELEKLEECIIQILCKLEKIFPLAFFDVMIHLAVHLPREAILGGPVQYRWMYPIERFLGALRKYVTNQARPKGSIAEAYIVKECITFCSMYVDGIKTVHNRPEQNEDRGERQQGLTVFAEIARLIGLITRDAEMSQEIRDIAHWFVLYNSPEIEKEHKNLLQTQAGHDITHIQRQEFPKWFKERINRLKMEESLEATDELWSLANGPNLLVEEYSGRLHDFYGHLCKVLEFDYICGKKVVLFQCEWYNTGNTGRNRTIQFDTYCISIDVTSRWYQSDPFILPSQAKQVFYLNDTKLGEPWNVVQRVQHRCVFDVPDTSDGELLDPLENNDVFQQENITDVVPIGIDPIVRYCRDDVEFNVISEVGSSDAIMEENRDDEGDEEHSIPNVDMDPDMDYDM